jgi:hypothetical protein
LLEPGKQSDPMPAVHTTYASSGHIAVRRTVALPRTARLRGPGPRLGGRDTGSVLGGKATRRPSSRFSFVFLQQGASLQEGAPNALSRQIQSAQSASSEDSFGRRAQPLGKSILEVRVVDCHLSSATPLDSSGAPACGGHISMLVHCSACGGHISMLVQCCMFLTAFADGLRSLFIRPSA